MRHFVKTNVGIAVVSEKVGAFNGFKVGVMVGLDVGNGNSYGYNNYYNFYVFVSPDIPSGVYLQSLRQSSVKGTVCYLPSASEVGNKQEIY